ncbi:hypothetical protein [Nonomuraea sp. NPDC049784]|uniref:hypothetical protein n=1 Tax=Nonomuraea sp. NPDC049784 TaxID=3154361 RepID=UPI0033E0C2BF
MNFSDAFDIANPEQYEWFDPILDCDTLLFVDPFLIFKSEDAKWRDAHGKMIKHFHDAFDLLARSQLNPKHQFFRRAWTQMLFPEPKEFRLGFGRKSADGSGTGAGLATRVIDAMCQAVKRGLEDIDHFEELGILVSGINRDRISDITCNLLKPELIEYTQHVCHSLGIPTVIVNIDHARFDESRNRWVQDSVTLPVDPGNGKPIILVPKSFLGELPALSSSNWKAFLDTSLRDDLNLEISTQVDKGDIVAVARKSPGHLREWIRLMELTSPKPYNVDDDPKLLVKWQKVARKAASEIDLGEIEIQCNEDLLKFAHKAVGLFRRWVEDLGGWRALWSSVADGISVPEPIMQLMLLGVMDDFCTRYDIRLDREVETGRGPVDFTFSGDNRMRVLLEIKKLTHGHFWNGLHVQTPIYMNGQGVRHAIFLAIRDSDTPAMRERWNTLEEEADRVCVKTGLMIEIARIDALPKKPASKETESASEENATEV